MNKLVGLICVAILLAVFAQGFVERPAMTKEELGRNLFFDPILSRNHTVSCASCHKPDFAFADTSSFSAGVNGRMGNRNTPWSKTSLWLGFLVAKFSHEDTKPLRKIQYQQQPGTRNQERSITNPIPIDFPAGEHDQCKYREQADTTEQQCGILQSD